ncbi:hypothetical protein [Variovorax sp. WS11]|uniref:hypothetical protein n=1 Tax=Variovorax sp. WS11 TaxID=1105204 RepID=UPI0011B2025C|nr:hypothetical protein [Variovorax sp. WS11]NDZ16980.1 hypothetical protein [Variovorax sp. WS11]
MFHGVPSIHLLQWVAPLLLAVLTSSVLAQRAERPDIKVGDRWKYEQRDRRTGGSEARRGSMFALSLLSRQHISKAPKTMESFS